MNRAEMLREDLKALMDAIGGVIRASVVAPLTARLDEQAARIAALEARPPGVRHRGTWQPNENYSPGELCTDHGSLWLAQAPTSTRPGVSPDWLLIVKRGRA